MARLRENPWLIVIGRHQNGVMEIDLQFGRDTPQAPDVATLLAAHLEFSHAVTPPGHVHALDHDGLDSSDVSLFSLRADGRLLAVGALRTHESDHLEIKSMHTLTSDRGQGYGRLMLERLIGEARSRGATRISLETGTYEAFTPARRLYESVGFTKCAPFGDYWQNPNSVCMTLELDADATSPK